MSISGTERHIQVVPHFMRLHEWIALEDRLYEAEGLVPDLLPEVMHRVSSHGPDPYFDRPQDLPFVGGQEVANSACEWGSVCNAGAGMGRFVPDLYGMARFAIMARPDAALERLADLSNVPVGVGLMAGSHFTALRTLESVLPAERIQLVNVGGPGRRLLALRQGEVTVANLLDPEIPIAKAEGLVTLGEGEFRTLFWVSADIPADVLATYFRALKQADARLRATPERYLHLWERNLPAGLEGDHDYSRFGRGELLVFEPYPVDVFDQTVQFARRWGLAGNMREDSFEALRTPALRI